MQIIGHRGAKGLAPENTVRGIKYALECGVDWIEFDVRATKDGEVVVVHDATINRIAKGRGKVSRYTFTELSAIATKTGDPIPTLADIMQAIEWKAKVNIELKSNGCIKTVAAEIKRQVAQGRPYSDFLISSFKPKLLRQSKRYDADIPRALLHATMPIRFLFHPALKLGAVGFFHLHCYRWIIRLARKRGLWTYAYYINSQPEADRIESMGVDAVVTDVPQNFRPHWPLWIILSGATVVCLAAIAISQFVF